MVKRVDVGRADGVAVVVVGLDGHLQAMVGSRDWHTSQLNAAACRRPVGSTLKPLIYALAVELGVLGLEDRVSDRPLVYSDWRPANFHSDLRGAMRMGDALATSRNLPAVDLLERVGLPPFVDLLRSLGLPTDPRGVHLDAALGTLSASPLELAHAWVRFVAQPEAHGLSRRSVDPILAALSERPLAAGMNSTRGGSIAWKSGTSSGRRDAWCVGVTEAHVTVVWRGTLDGRATPDLLGVDSAGRLLAEVVGSL